LKVMRPNYSSISMMIFTAVRHKSRMKCMAVQHFIITFNAVCL